MLNWFNVKPEPEPDLEPDLDWKQLYVKVQLQYCVVTPAERHWLLMQLCVFVLHWAFNLIIYVYM